MEEQSKTRLLLWGGFSSVVLMITLLMAIGLSLINEGIREQEAVSYNNILKTELLNTMRATARERNVSLQRMLSIEDDAELELEWERIGEFGGQFTNARQQYFSMQPSEDEIQLLEYQEELSNNVGPLQNRIAEMLIFGEREQARKLLFEQAIPNQEAVFQVLSELVNMQKILAEEAASNAQANYQLVLESVIIVAVLVLLICIYIINYVIKLISKDERELRRHRNHLEEMVQERTERLSHALELAEQASIAKSEFVSTVSHELRTPLTSILGSLGLVLSGKMGELSDKGRDLLSVAENNANRLTLLINDILDIQKIESGKMEFHFVDVELNSLLHQVVENTRPFANKNRINIESNIGDENVYVHADPDRLTQVINNLLSNAIKFSPENDAVELRLEDWEEMICIRVLDHGPGIPLDYRDKIFEKFTQVDSSDTRSHGGTGLGLNISRAIIEKHQGQIGVMDNSGGGSVFYVDLPKPRPE